MRRQMTGIGAIFSDCLLTRKHPERNSNISCDKKPRYNIQHRQSGWKLPTLPLCHNPAKCSKHERLSDSRSKINNWCIYMKRSWDRFIKLLINMSAKLHNSFGKKWTTKYRRILAWWENTIVNSLAYMLSCSQSCFPSYSQTTVNTVELYSEDHQTSIFNIARKVIQLQSPVVRWLTMRRFT